MKRNSVALAGLLAILLITPCSAAGSLRLPAIISDHAVLQAGKPIAIWGWADAQAKVTVTFNANDGKTRQFVATAGDGGRWS